MFGYEDVHRQYTVASLELADDGKKWALMFDG